jgi:hypothetical protein
MTQIRTSAALILLAAFAALGVLSLAPAGQTAQPELQTVMRAIDLPEPEFIEAMFGSGTEVPALEAERLGRIAGDVCTQLGRGFTYMSVREGLVAVYGVSTGEAGLLMSAAEQHVCA